MDKQLYRVKEGSMICGVCTGLGRYLNMDPTVVRLIWVLLSLSGGLGVLAYLIAALIMPKDPSEVQ